MWRKSKLDDTCGTKFVYKQCDQIKIAKCQLKLPKNGFIRKMNDFDTFTNIAQD